MSLPALLGDVLAHEAPCQEADGTVTDLGRAAGSADVAADTAEGFLGTAGIITALGQGDVLHDLDALGTVPRTGVAVDAVVDFRIELADDVAGYGQVVHIVSLFLDGK